MSQINNRYPRISKNLLCNPSKKMDQKGHESTKSITPVKLDGLEPHSTGSAHPTPTQMKRPFFGKKTVHFGGQAHFWTQFGSRPATEAPFKSGWPWTKLGPTDAPAIESGRSYRQKMNVSFELRSDGSVRDHPIWTEWYFWYFLRFRSVFRHQVHIEVTS